MKPRRSIASVLTLLSLVFFQQYALAGGGGAPADPGPDPNPNIEDVPGNFVQNGNFEELSTSVGEKNGHTLNDTGWRGWELYQRLPHWFTSFGSGIEVQRSASVYPSDFGGGQYVELDSDYNNNDATNSWMTQKINGLTPGENYLLEFIYHRNPQTGSMQERGVAAYFGKRIPGKLACTANTDNSQDAWIEIACPVTASSTTMFLTFAGFGDENTGKWGNGLGGLIDIVRLTVSPP